MNKEFAKKIVDILDKECGGKLSYNADFGYDSTEDSLNDGVQWDIEKALRKNNIEDFFFASGASKFVIVLEEEDFVIKIPYDGEYYWNYEEEDIVYEPFHKANLFTKVDYDWNYCEVERILYKRAKLAGVGQFFSGVVKIGEVEGRPVYAQEIAITYGEGGTSGREASEYAKNSFPSVSSKIYTDCHFHAPEDWLCAAIDIYGMDAINKLSQFIHDNQIADLHYENIGFSKDGLPVIMDYSSYNENE